MITRDAVPRDYEAIAQIVEHWNPKLAQQMQRGHFTRNCPELVAVEGSEVLGWLRGHHEQTEVWKGLSDFADRPEGWRCSYIVQLCVAREHRGKSVGSDLLSAFADDALARGNSLVVLTPDASEPGRETSLHAFYRKSGYFLADSVGSAEPYLLAKHLEI